MQRGHAREPEDSEPQRELEAPAEPPARAPQQLLTLQRTAGNHAVQQMLARAKFSFSGRGVQLTKLKDQDKVKDAVEDILEERYDGVQALFMSSRLANTREQWSDLLLEHLQETYDFGDMDADNVLEAVTDLKNEHRASVLQHMATQHVFSNKDVEVYTADDLRDILTKAGAYLEDDADEQVLEALVQTEGKFTRLGFEVPDDHLELSDEDSIVVLLDSHQNKHQLDLIGQLPPYYGEPGDKFARGKDLAWHGATTEPVVRQHARAAIDAGEVTADRNFYLPKKAIGMITYDLTVSYDELSGRYVASYHCNPIVNGW